MMHKTEVLRSDSHINNDLSSSCDNSQYEVLREDDRGMSLEMSTVRKDRKFVQNNDNEISEDDYESESETLCCNHCDVQFIEPSLFLDIWLKNMMPAK